MYSVKCRYRERITHLGIDLLLDIVYEINCILTCSDSFRPGDVLVGSVLPALRNLYLYKSCGAGIDGVIVHLNDFITLSAVSSLCSLFHQTDSILLRNYLGQREECRLKNRIDPSAQSDLLTDLDTVDGIELDIVLCNVAFYLSGQMLLQLLHASQEQFSRNVPPGTRS